MQILKKELGCTTLKTVKYGAEDHGKDEAEVSLHAAAEEGNISTLKSLIEQGMDINTQNPRSQTPFEHRLLHIRQRSYTKQPRNDDAKDTRERWGAEKSRLDLRVDNSPGVRSGTA